MREVGGEVVFLPKLNAIAMALVDQHEMTFTEGAVAIGSCAGAIALTPPGVAGNDRGVAGRNLADELNAEVSGAPAAGKKRRGGQQPQEQLAAV